MAGEEAERYLKAAEAALQQLDWCIEYLRGIRKKKLARALEQNRSSIQQALRDGREPLRSEASTPS